MFYPTTLELSLSWTDAVLNFTPAILTLISAIGAVYVRYWLNIQNRRKKLRHALYAEMDSTSWLDRSSLADLRGELEEKGASHSYVPTAVFDASVSDLGLLNEEELRDIIQYYNTAHVAKEQINSIKTDGEDSNITTFVERTLRNLVNEREDAMEKVSESIDISDGSSN